MSAAQSATWRQWSTTIEVVTRGFDLAAAVDAVRSELADVDAACNRFRSDSELSTLNRTHDGRPVAISPVFHRYLVAALEMAAATDGLVDPTLGVSLRQLGYDADIDEVRRSTRSISTELTARRRASWRDVVVTERDNGPGAWVQLPLGVELDLGATAKALAADRAAASAHEATDAGVLVALGGDLAMVGSQGQPWLVQVSETTESAHSDGAQVVASDGGLATSTTLARRWQTTHGTVHHLLDPTTGLAAAEYWRTVSVAAQTCLQANAASTAAVIRGRGAAEWLSGLGLPARLVRHDGVVVTTPTWPEGGSNPADTAESAVQYQGVDA